MMLLSKNFINTLEIRVCTFIRSEHNFAKANSFLLVRYNFSSCIFSQQFFRRRQCAVIQRILHNNLFKPVWSVFNRLASSYLTSQIQIFYIISYQKNVNFSFKNLSLLIYVFTTVECNFFIKNFHCVLFFSSSISSAFYYVLFAHSPVTRAAVQCEVLFQFPMASSMAYLISFSLPSSLSFSLSPLRSRELRNVQIKRDLDREIGPKKHELNTVPIA